MQQRDFVQWLECFLMELLEISFRCSYITQTHSSCKYILNTLQKGLKSPYLLPRSRVFPRESHSYQVVCVLPEGCKYACIAKSTEYGFEWVCVCERVRNVMVKKSTLHHLQMSFCNLLFSFAVGLNCTLCSCGGQKHMRLQTRCTTSFRAALL